MQQRLQINTSDLLVDLEADRLLTRIDHPLPLSRAAKQLGTKMFKIDQSLVGGQIELNLLGGHPIGDQGPQLQATGQIQPFQPAQIRFSRDG